MFANNDTQGEVADIVTYTEYLIGWLRCSDTPKLWFPIDIMRRLYNSVLFYNKFYYLSTMLLTICRRGTPRRRWVRRGPRRRQATRTRRAKERKAARSPERRSDWTFARKWQSLAVVLHGTYNFEAEFVNVYIVNGCHRCRLRLHTVRAVIQWLWIILVQ